MSLDILFANARLAPHEAGLYSAAAILAKTCYTIPSILVLVYYARAVRKLGSQRSSWGELPIFAFLTLLMAYYMWSIHRAQRDVGAVGAL